MSKVTNETISNEQQIELISDAFSSLEPILGLFVDYPFAVFLAILSISIFLAMLATLFIRSVIGKFTKKTNIHWDDQIIRLLLRPVFWSLTLSGFLIALIPLKLPNDAQSVVQSIVITVFIILWASFLLRLIRIVLREMSNKAELESTTTTLIRPQTRPLFQNLAFIIVIVVTIYLIFRSWNIDMTAWLASAGIAGIAIGFAAKDTLANLFSGVFILADGPYKIGDYVVLDSGERGKVTHIGIRSTRLLTREDVEITIPNAIMGNTRISNQSGGPHEKYRLRVKIGVAYGSDIDQVKAILLEVALSEIAVCRKPEPRVRFRNFGNSSLDIELLCWVENPEVRGRVLDALNTTIYKRFNTEGIEIPYSKHDVFIKEMPQTKI